MRVRVRVRVSARERVWVRVRAGEGLALTVPVCPRIDHSHWQPGLFVKEAGVAVPFFCLLAFFVEMPDSSLHPHELISAQVLASK